MKSLLFAFFTFYIFSPAANEKSLKSPDQEIDFSLINHWMLDFRADTIDIKSLADSIVAKKGLSTYEKVRTVIDWTNKNFEWTATDYKRRTAIEVIDRRGGNCNEQAMVVRELLKQLNILTRRIREINIQPESERRELSSNEKIKELGLRYSVFGYRHNDHVWIEFYDEEQKTWLPADPTLGLVGTEQWLKSRIGFEARPVHEIIPSRDMLVPITILAQDDIKGDFVEDRSSWYLIDQFNAVYNGALEKQKAWNDWVRMIKYISPKCKEAFEGKTNLHDYTDSIAKIKEIYLQLKSY